MYFNRFCIFICNFISHFFIIRKYSLSFQFSFDFHFKLLLHMLLDFQHFLDILFLSHLSPLVKCSFQLTPLNQSTSSECESEFENLQSLGITFQQATREDLSCKIFIPTSRHGHALVKGEIKFVVVVKS